MTQPRRHPKFCLCSTARSGNVFDSLHGLPVSENGCNKMDGADESARHRPWTGHKKTKPAQARSSRERVAESVVHFLRCSAVVGRKRTPAASLPEPAPCLYRSAAGAAVARTQLTSSAQRSSGLMREDFRQENSRLGCGQTMWAFAVDFLRSSPVIVDLATSSPHLTSDRLPPAPENRR